MKKILSLFLALTMLLSALSAGTVIYAADAKTVDRQIKGAANYILENATEFNAENSADFLMIIRAGVNVSKYKNGYADNIKSNLQKNGGKLLFARTSYTEQNGQWIPSTTYVEDFCLTAGTILCLKALGYNPASFAGYNLQTYFTGMDRTKAESNPYHYRLAMEAADKTLAKKIADEYVKNYYVMGSGLNYWGFSCDNTGNFLAGIASVKDSYKTYVEDAKKVLKAYTRDNGAFCDDYYSKEVNANSTANALLGFAAIDDLTNAEKYYNWLVNGFAGSKTGVFKAYGFDDPYATKDALLALEYYKAALDKEAARVAAEKAKAAAAQKKAIQAFKNKKTKITRLNRGKKRIWSVFKTISGAQGYELQYSTSKKFTKKTTKTVTIKNGKAHTYFFKKLKAKKKYYFRVRGYKTIGGKKVYSRWSAVKAQKTK